MGILYALSESDMTRFTFKKAGLLIGKDEMNRKI